MSDLKRRGRPVEAGLDERLFAAAIGLVERGGSFGDVSVDAVCAAAGASKASFYRRWSDRDAFIVALMASLRKPRLPDLDGSLEDDLVAMLDTMFGEDPRRTRAIHAALISEGRRNRRIIEAYLRDVVQPRREAVVARLQAGVEAGVLAADTDIAVLHELLTAPVLKYLMLHDPDVPVPDDFTSRLVHQALAGARPLAPARTPG